ncbi:MULTISPECIES: aspartate/glutamate racemase family protein [Rhodococcus]|uniref:Aspartate/glutamate racemase family protein n=1 Tax=Rhodococcus rhodochrous TaxID=1829 RepID=A0AA46WUV8_RHORH|nr:MULTISPECIES: aspartate/glutamate racemase family protein [Rhodococcus]MBF4480141.1 hydrogenase expression protein HupH [Rhodococcus rhodochrous]TWH37975.1 allantoin racemase [Rhodococcus rhodochrous J38]UZF44365.1 aspartate/glutamate racemase family protein [Rhodococcus rhodochrous]WSE21917.1 aspartate/glutamate racemase family protein [Rhodococcus sp. PD04]
MKRVLNIVPVPVPPEALDAFAAQLSGDYVHPAFENVFVSARNGGGTLDSAYETTLADAFVLDAGCRAEEQGYVGVCVNSMSDSALAALRSRLSIPVVAPSQATMLLACMLGKKFSVITMWPQWHELYHKAARENGIMSRLASVRDIGVRPDTAELLAGKEDFVFAALEREAKTAIAEDGADVIILGSTTMHQSHAHLSTVLDVPVLNPGVVAYKMCEMLVQTGLSHSKQAYPSPERPQDDLLAAVASVFPSKES